MDINKYIEQLPRKAVKQRKDGSYTVMPRMSQGRINAVQLAAINKVVHDFGLPEVRITAGQQLLIDGVPEENLEAVIRCLGPVGSANKNRVQGCLGTSGCNLGQQDSQAVAARLAALLDKYKTPTKVKAGVSGCSMCCAESMARDVGLIGRKQGWTVSFGGNAGKRVRQGDVLAQDVSEENAFGIIDRALRFYAENAKAKERTARFVERVGVQELKEVIFSK